MKKDRVFFVGIDASLSFIYKKKEEMILLLAVGKMYVTKMINITKTCQIKYTENFTTKKKKKKKKKKIRITNSDIFYISAQNMNCGYSLELPRRGDSNKYPQFMLLSRNNKNNV